MSRFFDNHHAYYPAHYQLISLMDLLDGQGVHHHQYLKGTGLFYDDMISGEKVLTAAQYVKLIENAQKLGDKTLAFRWGHAMWPGHYDVFSQLLNSTNNLRDLLDVIRNYSQVFCPLLKPYVETAEEHTFIYWQDEMGVSKVLDFLVASYSTAMSSICHWYQGEKLLWRICFSCPQPKLIEEYQVNLGGKVQFDMGVNVMAIANVHLNEQWGNKRNSDVIYAILERQANNLYSVCLPGFIGAVGQWCQKNIDHHVSLNQAAVAFEMSSATFKRKLKQHFTSFQKIQDQARLHTCLYLQYEKQWNNQQVADYLKFSDANNFRKAFKRWCGNTPSVMKQKLTDIISI
ncbi:AraC family transcriptional regulator [Oceaniserpentilla sp. 4NH20-0058]|uniref:AraC family transcriptional regulator n=1 Tax=Oceaniserpentilla sp. 4NH20-0058 TaxID=3127660 RepID=UPI003105FC7D